MTEDEAQKTVEVLLPAGSTLAGASLRELRFRQRHNATVLALRRGQETLQERLGQIVLRKEMCCCCRLPSIPFVVCRPATTCWCSIG